MNFKSIIVFLAIANLTASCNHKPTVNGLWIVKQVKVGEQIMTPNARWMRFNADSTQQSGNGWYQHSFGTWRLDATSNLLTVVNTNGLKDPYGDFKVQFENGRMIWARTEEGENVEVSLERTHRLPEAFGDQVLGLWRLENAVGEGKYFAESQEGAADAFIFFRWDRRFSLSSGEGRTNGVYNVHGHRPEVELIPYGEHLERDFWSFEIENNTLTLKLLNSDSLVSRRFVRIRDFPG